MAWLPEFQYKNTTSGVPWTLLCYCPQQRQAVAMAEKGPCVTVAMYGSTRKAQSWPRVCLKGLIGSLRFCRLKTKEKAKARVDDMYVIAGKGFQRSPHITAQDEYSVSHVG